MLLGSVVGPDPPEGSQRRIVGWVELLRNPPLFSMGFATLNPSYVLNWLNRL